MPPVSALRPVPVHKRLAPLLPSPHVVVLVALPFAVALAMWRVPEPLIERVIAGVLAIGFLVLVQKHPERALLALIAFIPLQLAVFSLAYRLGVPGQVLRPLGAYRDGIVIGIVVVALRAARAREDRLDVIDKLAITFIAINALYFALPTLFVRPPDEVFAGPIRELPVRTLALRLNVTPILLFLAVRHLRPSPEFRARAIAVVLMVGVVTAIVSIYEFALSDSWHSFTFSTLHVPHFQNDVLGLVTHADLRQYVEVGGREFTRPGGLLFDPLPNGFYLLLPFAAGVQLVQRQRAPLITAALALISTAILLTYVRSAILGAAVVVMVALRHAGHRRVQFGIALFAGVLFVLITAAGTGYVPRFGDPGSDELHRAGLQTGLETLRDHPMGLGLGSAPGIGSRFGTSTRVTAESAYLQVGNELGVIAMLVFVALLATAMRRLLSRRSEDDTVAWAASSGAALVAAGLFLHVWISITVALTYWAIAGAALARSDNRRDAPIRHGPT